MEKVLNLITEYFERSKKVDELKRKINKIDIMDKTNFSMSRKPYILLDNHIEKGRAKNILDIENAKLEIIRHKLYLLEKYLDRLDEEMAPGHDYDGDLILIEKFGA